MLKYFSVKHTLSGFIKNKTSCSVLLMLLIAGFARYSLADPVQGKILSTYIEQQLKSKPVADYKIPQKEASETIDISKLTNFAWDKAVIFGQLDFKARICFLLALDKDECERHDFDKLVKTKRYFIVFSKEHKVVYTEVFDDEILLFGINTIGRVITPDRATISVYHDITVKYRHDEARATKYKYYVLMVVLPIGGFLFGIWFPVPSLIIATVLLLPLLFMIYGLTNGEGNPLGWAGMIWPILISFLTSIGMYVSAIYVTIKKRAIIVSRKR